MLNWNDRPFEIAYSLNPAFLAILLYQAIESFQKENKRQGMPYALVFLIIPLVFYTPIRENLPKNINQSLHKWLKNNPQIAIHLHRVISDLVPYTKEAIIFAMQHEIVWIDKHGCFNKQIQLKVESLIWSENSRTYQMKESAKFLGAWFAKLDNIELIYRTLGITP